MKFIILLLQAMLALLAVIVLFVYSVDVRFEALGFFVFGVGLSLLLIWALNKFKSKQPLSSYLSIFLLYLSCLFFFAGLHQLFVCFIYNKEGVIYSLILILTSVFIFLMGLKKQV